jgi:hypothetical protein
LDVPLQQVRDLLVPVESDLAVNSMQYEEALK